MGESTTPGGADAVTLLSSIPELPATLVLVVEALVAEADAADDIAEDAAAVAAAAAAMDALREDMVVPLEAVAAELAFERCPAVEVILDDALGSEAEEDALDDDAEDRLDEGVDDGWCALVP